MNRASKNRWHIERAISLAMEKVVVVVVVTIRDGSFGSGMRLDWENLSEPRLLIASSDRNVCSIFVNRTRWAESGSKLTINVEKRSLKSCVPCQYKKQYEDARIKEIRHCSCPMCPWLSGSHWPLGNDARAKKHE